jgi:xanthine dehydrogenase small subunit
MFLPMAAGREIFTVESLAADGELCDAQRAMASGGGSQCGYCTPGFVVSLFAEQHRPDRDGACDTMALAGNLCRCTGYRPIRDAAQSLGPAPPSAFLERLRQPTPELEAFDVPGFSRPATVDACLSILKRDPDARLVSGATDMGVEANVQHRRWSHLVSVEAIDELREFSETQDRVMIGAGLPLNDIGRLWHDAPGGNLATASPIGDAAPMLLALDANVHIAAQTGRRMVPLASFFTGYRKTAISAGEMLTAIEVPKPLPQFVRFYKIAKRRLDDISTVAAAMALDLDGAGRVRRARFALGGVAATPMRVIEAEDAVIDQLWNESAVDRVQRAFDRVLQPMSDHRGSKEFRLEVSKSLVEKYQWEFRA